MTRWRARTFYYWRNEAAEFWLERAVSGFICKALAAFDYLYLSGSLAILSPTSRDGCCLYCGECRASGGRKSF